MVSVPKSLLPKRSTPGTSNRPDPFLNRCCRLLLLVALTGIPLPWARPKRRCEEFRGVPWKSAIRVEFGGSLGQNGLRRSIRCLGHFRSQSQLTPLCLSGRSEQQMGQDKKDMVGKKNCRPTEDISNEWHYPKEAALPCQGGTRVGFPNGVRGYPAWEKAMG